MNHNESITVDSFLSFNINVLASRLSSNVFVRLGRSFHNNICQKIVWDSSENK